MLSSQHASPFYATSKVSINSTYIGPDTAQPHNDGLNLNLTHEQKANLGDLASNATSIVPVVLHGVDGATNSNGPLTIIGGLTSGYSQWERDQDLPLSNEQRLGRGAITGFESAVSSFGGNGVGVTGLMAGVRVGSVFGPAGAFAGGLIGYTSAYFLTVNVTNQGWSEVNKKLYPNAGLNP